MLWLTNKASGWPIYRKGCVWIFVIELYELHTRAYGLARDRKIVDLNVADKCTRAAGEKWWFQCLISIPKPLQVFIFKVYLSFD